MRQIALRGLDPRIEVLGFQHERGERLAGVRRLGEVEGQDREGEMQLGRLADRTDRHVGVVHVLGDCLVLLLRRDIFVAERLVEAALQVHRRAQGNGKGGAYSVLPNDL